MREELPNGLVLDTEHDRKLSDLHYIPEDGDSTDPRAWTGALYGHDKGNSEVVYYVAADDGGPESRFATPRIQEVDTWEAHRLVCCDATEAWSADDLIGEFQGYAVNRPTFASRTPKIDPQTGEATIFQFNGQDGDFEPVVLNTLDPDGVRATAEDYRRLAQIGDQTDAQCREARPYKARITERVDRFDRTPVTPDPEAADTPVPGGP